jgi:GrpB-like predicted nucleotidyltransferase (UPF0157 family)
MRDDIPQWAAEKAKVLPHDPQLTVLAAVERARLAQMFSTWLVDGVEHVGSTAVPGLPAKPIIDLAASVTDPDEVVRRAGSLLTAEGWRYVPPELDNRSWRRFFVKPDATGQYRVAHLHLIAAGHPRWAAQLVFRDRLRADAQLAAAYAALKYRLSVQYEGDREAYTDAKAEFVAQALADASP